MLSGVVARSSTTHTRKMHRLLPFLFLAQPCTAPNTYSPTGAIWSNVKRCDMLDDKMTYFGKDPRFGKSDYKDGAWVAATPARPSVAAEHVPISCEEGGSSGGLCHRFFGKCYGRFDKGKIIDRPPYSTYAALVKNLHYVWQPSNGCHFSPPVSSKVTLDKWKAWAKGLEQDGGPMLWVGDDLLAETFVAWQSLTGGATNSTFHKAQTLVNSYTLAPMSAAEVSACEASSGASSGSATIPCPPVGRHPTLWWENNDFHQLHNLKWVQAFEANAATLKTLVLGVGSEFWRTHLYSSSADGCRTDGGVSHAFLPLTSLGLLDHETYLRTCDVFDVKYRQSVRNVAAYVASVSAFKGKVVFITSPSGIKGCEGSTAPNALPSAAARFEADLDKRAYWFHTNAQGAIFHPDVHGNVHAFGRLRANEHEWRAAFSKHASRLKLSVLNISVMSDSRPDALAPGSDCAAFCYPGLPHHWAEMMLRMVEQMVYGVSDGLANVWRD